jgi:hypothetical protein
MGLDTVELVMKFEKYFNTKIPDRVAGQMTTLQEAADSIARIMGVTNTAAPLRDYYFTMLHNLLARFDAGSPPFQLSSPIAVHISPKEELNWQRMEQVLQLKVPVPVLLYPEEAGWERQVKKLVKIKPAYDWNSISVEQFILAIAAANYELLIQPAAITNTFEILVSVAGITVYHSGADYYEARPESSFTSDLGLD